MFPESTGTESSSTPFGVRLSEAPLGTRWLLSLAYMWAASMNCRMLLTHPVRLARSFAPDKAGNSMAAKIAIIAITTSSSIKVKAACFLPALKIECIEILGFLRWFSSDVKAARLGWADDVG